MVRKVAHTNARETSWPVKMAQYVPPPSVDAFASLLPSFKRRRGSNLPGTWLSSKSMATVTLSSGSSNGIGPSIALILRGQVHEEHLLSNLAFAWPRFRDENEDTSSPGRVIFGSYKETCSNKKHKFAMQFETVLQAEWFFETVKQLIDHHNGALEGMSNVGIQQANSGLQAEIIETHPSFSGHGTSMIISHEAMSTRSSNLTANVLPLSELSSSTSSKQNLPVVLPPRFPLLDTQHHSFTCDIVSEQQEGESSTVVADDLQNEQLLKEKLKVCFSDPEFQDFVSKVERIWHSMEEDLANELSSNK